MQDQLSIKASYSNGVVRRFSLPKAATFEEVSQVLTKLQPSDESYTIQYKDNEGDNISVNSQLEWTEAVNLYTQAATEQVDQLFRITVVVEKHAKPEYPHHNPHHPHPHHHHHPHPHHGHHDHPHHHGHHHPHHGHHDHHGHHHGHHGQPHHDHGHHGHHHDHHGRPHHDHEHRGHHHGSHHGHHDHHGHHRHRCHPHPHHHHHGHHGHHHRHGHHGHGHKHGQNPHHQETTEQTRAPAVHFGVTCDGCQQFPLRGIRYNCDGCPNFDFCEPCYQRREALGHAHHSFTAREEPARGKRFGCPWMRRKHGECTRPNTAEPEPKCSSSSVAQDDHHTTSAASAADAFRLLSHLFHGKKPATEDNSQEQKPLNTTATTNADENNNSSSNTTTTTTPQQSDEDNDFKMELELLSEMGLCDLQGTNVIELLRKFKGDVQKVVAEYLSNQVQNQQL